MLECLLVLEAVKVAGEAFRVVAAELDNTWR
jgi:hypothetical protein